MKVSVVTPYFKESLEVLKRCHDSVLAQTHSDTFHVMVSDGQPCPEIDKWERVVHIKVPHHGDYGDTPRAIGSLVASNQGAEAITLLDADNWFDPDHVDKLYTIAKNTGAQVVTGTRTLYRTDGTRLGVCNESDGRNFNDTNCYFMTKPTFPAFSVWGYKDPRDGIIGDRIFWSAVQRAGFSRAHCMEPTTNYVTSFACHYQAYGEVPPPGAKVIVRLQGETHSKMISFKEYEKLVSNSK
jgi:glycosyltransferase involved in cell wall biosynthesis